MQLIFDPEKDPEISNELFTHGQAWLSPPPQTPKGEQVLSNRNRFPTSLSLQAAMQFHLHYAAFATKGSASG